MSGPVYPNNDSDLVLVLQPSLGGQGAQGLKGDQGVQGPQGVTGSDGTGITLRGTVDDVEDLPSSGNTVGDLYIVTNEGGDGYVWDGVEWINVGPIQGPQGNQGFQGATGAQGAQGNQGHQGHQGHQGVQGITGAQGDTGSQGDQGFQGLTGSQGEKGDQGDQGDQGFQGDQGLQGDQGNQGEPSTVAGPQGFQGDQGDIGAQGAQGSQGDQGDQGIPGAGTPGNDDVGVIFLKNNTTATTISETNARAVVAGTMETGELYNFAKDSGTNSLKYTGAGGQFHIVATFNFFSTNQNICGFYIGRNIDDTSSLDPNGDRISESEIYANASNTSTQPVSSAIQTVVDLDTDDRVYFIVQNKTGANSITVEFLKFTVTPITSEKGDQGPQGPQGVEGQSVINLDGGEPNSVYGGILSIDAGNI
jgi:hypothetical protein